MVSKSTTLIGFRFPARYISSLDAEAKANKWSRSGFCADILKWASEAYTVGGESLKKHLEFGKIKRDRARMSGKSIVICVRLPNEVATGIRELARCSGNNVSEWCGNVMLRQL